MLPNFAQTEPAKRYQPAAWSEDKNAEPALWLA